MTAITIEHLELAALAAGIELTYRQSSGAYYYDDPETGREEWRPHTDIADAARLAVRLRMVVDVEHGDVWARESYRDDGGHADHDGTEADAEHAYCAAVTRCAAAIGRLMREESR